MENLDSAYKYSMDLAKSHYENFPVVSIFLPFEVRKHVAVFYVFARTADDIADEGNDSPDERIARLNEFEYDLTEALSGNYKTPYWQALKYTVDKYNLDTENLYKLLSAFRQDVAKKRYENFDELLNYCSRSADPVGRTMLRFFGINDKQAAHYSDNICTALQLTNFWQDVSVDIKKGRIYIPLEDMRSFGVTEEQVTSGRFDAKFGALMRYQVERTAGLFEEGKQLFSFLPLRLKLQIKLTVSGGEKILEKIKKNNYRVLTLRPKLSKLDYAALLTSLIR